MESLLLKEIVKAVNGECDSQYQDMRIYRICTDSRKTKTGDMFIALEGENFDGHDYVQAAIQNGASAVLVSKPVTVKEVPVIQTENTLKALWQLSTYYRQKFTKPVIAVTGSVGKTSTKDMIATILSAKYAVHKSQANFNNHIGMPLTILELENHHDVMVVEMGMRGFGEIRQLTHIAKPSIAVITNIGVSHIERLGSRENILKAKLEIVEGLDKRGVLILNADDPLLAGIDRSIAGKVIYIGVNKEADYRAYDIEDHGEYDVLFKINLKGRDYVVHIPAVGKHNVYNVLFGIACGVELGLKPEEILTGIENYRPEKMRLNIVSKDGIMFINDCYNANPDSMRAGLQVLSNLAGANRSVAILGNMFELGEMAADAHFDIGRLCKELGIDFTAIIGENASDVARGIGDSSKYRVFNSHEEIVSFMKGMLKENDVVLIKGSRGMRMERILELW